MMLLSSAHSGARGNAATKIVTNPYCTTETGTRTLYDRKVMAGHNGITLGVTISWSSQNLFLDTFAQQTELLSSAGDSFAVQT